MRFIILNTRRKLSREESFYLPLKDQIDVSSQELNFDVREDDNYENY